MPTPRQSMCLFSPNKRRQNLNWLLQLQCAFVRPMCANNGWKWTAIEQQTLVRASNVSMSEWIAYFTGSDTDCSSFVFQVFCFLRLFRFLCSCHCCCLDATCKNGTKLLCVNGMTRSCGLRIPYFLFAFTWIWASSIGSIWSHCFEFDSLWSPLFDIEVFPSPKISLHSLQSVYIKDIHSMALSSHSLTSNDTVTQWYNHTAIRLCWICLTKVRRKKEAQNKRLPICALVMDSIFSRKRKKNDEDEENNDLKCNLDSKNI